jgi:hypothetical protein
MAKLVLKFEQAVQREVPLLDAAVTVGRLPDNMLQIDNPAVSSRHCRIVFENQHYFVEDNNSTNGTFLNKQRITRAQLKNGDELTIGKHTVMFADPVDAGLATKKLDVPMPRVDKTVMLDTKKAQEMLAAAKAAGVATGNVTPVAAKDRVGTLTVLDGKTDQPQYVLTGKLIMIGKSDMATIKLKGFFAPKAAAVINRREGKYFVAPAEKSVKVKINEAPVATQQELTDGDILEVGSVKMTFSFGD